MPNKEIPTFEEWPFRVPNLEKAAASAKAATAALEAAQTPEEALKVFKKHEKESDLLGNACTHAFVLFTLDSTNKKYAKAVAKIDEGMPLVQVEENHFAEAMLHSPHRAYLEKKLGTHLFTMYEYSLKGFDDRVVAEAVEENKLSTEYGAKLAAIRVTYKGQEYNLPQMGKFLQDLDRDVRKEASQAYYAALSTHVEELEDIYDRLVHVRDAIAKKLGYKNFVELGYIRMQRYDYNVEDVRAYREAIHDVVTPIAAKIMKAQFKRTGIRKPEIYDNSLVFKTGNPMPKGTTADKIELAKKMYDALSPETSYFFRFMADHHVLDLEARPGKQGGGYMTYFPKYGIPFIFSNFNGTKGDIDVLTHEFGHSFQAYMARKIKVPELRQPTSEGCEIDSMSMEFFAHPWMDLFFDEPEKYRYAHLADAISFLPYGVTVDHFQEWVYENPNATKAERDAKWHELEEYYTPYKVATYRGCTYMQEGHRWLTQAHIFENPFYYIDYTLAQVMAFQFFNLDRKNHELAWKRYLKLCEMGGKYPFRTLVLRDHMKDPFAPGVVKKTVRPLMQVLESYDIGE